MTNYPPPRNRTPVWVIIILSLGGCGVLGCIILAAILFPVFQQAKEAAKKASCMSNMKQSALACLMYADDNNETLPRASKWMDQTQQYTRGEALLHCPSLPMGQYGYAMNDAMSVKKQTAIKSPAQTVLLFESRDTSRNAHGDPKRDVCAPRHGSMVGFAYVDGSARMNPSQP